jgi:hypothetical protein
VVTRSPYAMAAGGEWGRQRRPGSDRAAPRRDLVGGGGQRRGSDGEEGHAGEVDSALNRRRRRFLFRSVFTFFYGANRDVL